MIKKIILLLVLIVFYNISFSQDVNKNKWGCSFAINSVEAQIGTPLLDTWGDATNNFRNAADFTDHSISLSIIPKYFISEDVVLRFEIGITNINMLHYWDSYGASFPDPYTSHTIIINTIEQKINRYLPGIQWSFLKTKRIECYVGFSASYTHYSSMHYFNSYAINGLPKDTVSFLDAQNDIAKGGFAAGIGSFAGFNVHLFKYISIGAEFSSSLLYYKIGGEFDIETAAQFPKPPISYSSSYFTNSYKVFSFHKY